MKYLLGAKTWACVADRMRGKNLFIFLDFDGTLTTIASTPNKCFLSAAVKKILQEIAGNYKVRLAFISGRRLKDLKARVGVKNAVYSGNHGLEVEGPSIAFKSFVLPGYQRNIVRIKHALKRKIAAVAGAWVEDKGLTISLHYRLAEKNDIPAVKNIFQETIAAYCDAHSVKIRSGKMVFEVMPPIAWDKGKVVRWLCSQRSFVFHHHRGIPVYIGDDVTDEDAFRAISAKGITIFVGRPKKTRARYYVKDPGEVQKVLERISGEILPKIVG